MERQPGKERRISIGIVGALLTTLIGGYLAWDWWSGVPQSVQATYIGRQSCVQCHQQEVERYTGSFHDKAMDLATPETVLGDFTDAILEHHGITSRMFRRGDKFLINTEGPDGQLADFEIKYVFGVAPLQQYMVEFERPRDAQPHEIGRVQVLRVSWDTERQRWFNLDPPDVPERLQPGDDLHWTGISQRWNTMCADCHSTNLKRNFDPETTKYHTTFSEIDVSCEACHGPASVHVELASAWSPFWDRQRGFGLGRLTGERNIAEVEACAQCHSRRQVIHADYRPGEPFDSCFAVEPLQRLAYYADGSNRDEVYEHGSFTQSKMFHKNIRCSDCHDPHSTKLRFSGNKVCTSCHQHAASKYDTPAHHHHKEGSTGASCVECHMPATTYMAVDARRDHGFRVPRPDLSVRHGTPNACTQCHLADDKELAADKRSGLKQYSDWLASKDDDVAKSIAHLNQWCAEATAKWYPSAPGKRQARKEDKIVPAFTAARTGHPSSQTALAEIASDSNMPSIFRATALTELGQFARPGSLAEQASLAALEDPSPQVRVAALVNLAGLDPKELALSGAPRLSDSSRLVRLEAARLLSGTAREHLSRDARRPFHEALKEYFASLEELNDRPGSYLARGVTHENLGKSVEAERDFRLAMHLDPNTVGPRMNLATLLALRARQTKARAQVAAQQGDRRTVLALNETLAADDAIVGNLLQEEVRLLQRDAALAPQVGGLHYQLGATLALLERTDEALPALARAVELEPNEANYRFKLAMELERQGKASEGFPHARRALELWPEDQAYRELVDRLQRLVGQGLP